MGEAMGEIRTRGRAMLLATVAANVVAVLGVEVLSLVHAIRPLAVWVLIAAALATGITVAWREAPRGARARWTP